MKAKKTSTLILFILLVTLIFQSCSQKSFSDSHACKELSNRLKSEIHLSEGEFEEYSSEDTSFLFPSAELYDDICIIHSNDSTDVCEIGVFHASSEENAKRLFEEAKLYIKSMQEQKSEFLRNYSPEELPKLNSAEVRRLGNYVIFAIGEQEYKNNLFNKAEEILS